MHLWPLQELTAEGLSFTFPGTEYGVADITLRIPRGSFTVITGRNGSGKTTLLRVLLGLLPKDGRRNTLERAAGGTSGYLFRTPA